jgi:hypothetical protein
MSECVVVIEWNGDRSDSVHVLCINYAWGYVAALAPSDPHFFRLLYKHLDGKWCVADVKQAVPSLLLIFDINSSCVGVQPVVAMCKKCLNINYEYVEFWCVSSATHMPYVFRGLESVSVTLHSTADCAVASGWLLVNDELENVWKDLFLLWLHIYWNLSGSTE